MRQTIVYYDGGIVVGGNGTIKNFEGQAMIYVPGRGGCLRCVLGGVPENAATCAEAGVLGTIPGILGCVQATVS